MSWKKSGSCKRFDRRQDDIAWQGRLPLSSLSIGLNLASRYVQHANSDEEKC